MVPLNTAASTVIMGCALCTQTFATSRGAEKRTRLATAEPAGGPGKLECDDQTPSLAIREADAAAMRFGDLTGQRESEPRSTALGGVEGQERLRHDGIAHSAPPVPHFDELPQAKMRDGDLDAIRWTPALLRVLEQIDERLLELRAVEPAGLRRQRLDDAEAALLGKIVEQ